MASAVVLDYGLSVGGLGGEPVNTNDQLTMGDSLIAQLRTDAFAVSDSLVWSDGVTLKVNMFTAYLDEIELADSLNSQLQVVALRFMEPLQLVDSVGGLILSNAIAAQFADTFFIMQDSDALGYGCYVSDLVTLTDALASPYNVSNVDSLFLLDSLSTVFEIDWHISDAVTMLDACATSEVLITTSSLPQGWLNAPYIATLQATGGTSPYIWSLVYGSLPTGLSLSSGGVISGTPTVLGTSDFTIQVVDSGDGMARIRLHM